MKLLTIYNFFQHESFSQDIFVYRSATGSVETIETNGMWLGIIEDLGRLNENFEFVLNPGDVLLLYTDGITEAVHNSSLENKNLNRMEIMFEEKRLARVLEKNGNNTTSAIKDGILESLKDYYSNDDVTMLIVKRCE